MNKETILPSFSQSGTLITEQSATLPRDKYKYLLGRALHLDASEFGLPAETILSMRMHEIANKLKKQKDGEPQISAKEAITEILFIAEFIELNELV